MILRVAYFSFSKKMQDLDSSNFDCSISLRRDFLIARFFDGSFS